uniref:Uncharacterized protein n=1 Tax=Panthera tigris altaica TaxID=74533 RepID=A0A8C9KFJ0_PANTA
CVFERSVWRQYHFSWDYFSTGHMGRARRFHSSFFDVIPILDTGFSTFVSLGSRTSPPSSETFLPFVSSGMGNFRLVTTCSQIVNGKRVVTKKVLENVRGRPKWKKETYFIRFLHVIGKESVLCSFTGRLPYKAGESDAYQRQSWNLRVC